MSSFFAPPFPNDQPRASPAHQATSASGWQINAYSPIRPAFLLLSPPPLVVASTTRHASLVPLQQQLSPPATLRYPGDVLPRPAPTIIARPPPRFTHASTPSQQGTTRPTSLPNNPSSVKAYLHPTQAQRFLLSSPLFSALLPYYLPSFFYSSFRTRKLPREGKVRSDRSQLTQALPSNRRKKCPTHMLFLFTIIAIILPPLRLPCPISPSPAPTLCTSSIKPTPPRSALKLQDQPRAPALVTDPIWPKPALRQRRCPTHHRPAPTSLPKGAVGGPPEASEAHPRLQAASLPAPSRSPRRKQTPTSR